MDKFDRVVELVCAKAGDHEKEEVTVVAGVVADMLRCVETIGSDLDRIATTLERAIAILEV